MENSRDDEKVEPKHMQVAWFEDDRYHGIDVLGMVPRGTKPGQVLVPSYYADTPGKVYIDGPLGLANALIRRGIARGEDPRFSKSMKD